jgi:alpha-glucosidase
MRAEREYRWWQRGVIYEVYPRSFKDSDGDGVGDLDGMTEKLDYFTWLGIDAIWLCPIFRSPMADFGYDVSDYTDIEPVFGDLDAFDRLLREAHARGLKVILDFVPNHTSDQHPWFIESRSSRQSEKRDWYIWRDPAPGGGPPNNWQSTFGGSAWELDDASGQYYYHAFLKQQPDLNWRNPAVQAAMLDVMRFWLLRGVDGFRIDVIWHLVKDETFRENPENPEYLHGMPEHRRVLPIFNVDQPEVHQVISRMRRLAEEFGDRVLIGEIYLPIERLVLYYGSAGDGVHLPFNFHLLSTEWSPTAIAGLIERYEAALPPSGWPNWVLSNHDRPRIASRIGSEYARLAAMLLLTLRGTPTLYYGDELGLENVPMSASEVQDPYELNVPGHGLGRDPVRTPMQWDGTPNAGFTTGKPWLRLSDDHRSVNVASQSRDPKSILSLHRTLLHARREELTLQVGSYRTVLADENVLAFERRYGDAAFLVILNFSRDSTRFEIETGRRHVILVTTEMDRNGESIGGALDLRPGEGIVLEVA